MSIPSSHFSNERFQHPSYYMPQPSLRSLCTLSHYKPHVSRVSLREACMFWRSLMHLLRTSMPPYVHFQGANMQKDFFEIKINKHEHVTCYIPLRHVQFHKLAVCWTVFLFHIFDHLWHLIASNPRPPASPLNEWFAVAAPTSDSGHIYQNTSQTESHGKTWHAVHWSCNDCMPMIPWMKIWRSQAWAWHKTRGQVAAFYVYIYILHVFATFPLTMFDHWEGTAWQDVRKVVHVSSMRCFHIQGQLELLYEYAWVWVCPRDVRINRKPSTDFSKVFGSLGCKTSLAGQPKSRVIFKP